MKKPHSHSRINHLPSYFPILIAGITLLITYLCLTVVYFTNRYNISFDTYTANSTYPELTQLEGNIMTFAQLKQYFTDLAIKKGAVYSFTILNQAYIPAGTDLHLLAHSVGDVLYKQKGAEGMRFCTEDFRNACSHSIVINLFYEQGEAALNQIMESCKKAPGGIGAYTMCFHGLGHGVFAYTGYDLQKTVELCKKTATKEHHDREYAECVGGAVMEQISGGDHDKTNWSRMRYFNLLGKNNPTFPCISNVIQDQEPRNLCLIYMTPYFWELAGRTDSTPTDQVLTDSFKYCEQIDRKDTKSREACFGGFGKEFVVLANEEDVRDIQNITDIGFKQIYHWCGLISDHPGENACIMYAVGSMFWSGSIDRHVSMRFCQFAPDQRREMYCYQSVIEHVRRYNKDPEDRKLFCSELPDLFKSDCQTKLTTQKQEIQ